MKLTDISKYIGTVYSMDQVDVESLEAADNDYSLGSDVTLIMLPGFSNTDRTYRLFKLGSDLHCTRATRYEPENVIRPETSCVYYGCTRIGEYDKTYAFYIPDSPNLEFVDMAVSSLMRVQDLWSPEFQDSLNSLIDGYKYAAIIIKIKPYTLISDIKVVLLNNYTDVSRINIKTPLYDVRNKMLRNLRYNGVEYIKHVKLGHPGVVNMLDSIQLDFRKYDLLHLFDAIMAAETFHALMAYFMDDLAKTKSPMYIDALVYAIENNLDRESIQMLNYIPDLDSLLDDAKRISDNIFKLFSAEASNVKRGGVETISLQKFYDNIVGLNGLITPEERLLLLEYGIVNKADFANFVRVVCHSTSYTNKDLREIVCKFIQYVIKDKKLHDLVDRILILF